MTGGRSIIARPRVRRMPASLGGVLGTVLVAILLLLCAPALAGTKIPFSGAFHDEIDAVFFGPHHGDDARVVPEKLEAYRKFIAKKQQFLSQHVYNHETIDAGKSDARARAKLRRVDAAIALEHIQRLLARLENTRDTAEAHEIAAEILMVEYATRSYTEAIGSIEIPIHIKNMVFEWRAPDGTDPDEAAREASNLVNPDTGEFYTPDELEALIRAGFDISTLNPPAETPFWRAKPDISKVDIIQNYLEGGDPVHDGLVAEFPKFDGAELDLDKTHKTQSKPKLDVFFTSPACEKKNGKKKKCRRELKLKFGMETHADPTVNALLSALGFNTDVSMHLKNVRVNLGKHSLQEVEKDWIGYFDRQRRHTYIPLESVLAEGDAGRGRDEEGEFLVFKEAVAEVKPEQLERIGFFTFSWGMAAQMREARALFLFNAWIVNSDMKDEENNKLVLKRGASGDYRMYLIQQDLGHALGWVLPERPEAFPWDMVETNLLSRAFGWARGSIELNYIDLQNNGLERTATFADLKWMARLIAQLTRDQIETAVSLGHWPPGVAQLYVEKLINRRNQLVQAFGLEGEFALMPVDRHLTTEDGAVVDGHLVRNRWEESPIDYGHHWRDVFGPVGAYFSNLAKKGVAAGVAAVDVINPGDIRISAGFYIFPRILINLSRQVLLNPEPEGAFDQYIVVDSMDLGIRVGVGYVGSVEGTWIKRFSLAYPVRTETLGINAGIGVINFLLPYDIRKGRLPEKYVLLREDVVKRGFRASSDHFSVLSPLGVDAEQNWVRVHRSVIDHREKDPVIWIDEPDFSETGARLYFEAALVQIPFLKGATANGSLEGKVLTIDGRKLDVADDDGVAIFDKMVQRGDFSAAEKISLGAPRKVSSDFINREGRWNLLFASGRSRLRREKITLKDAFGAPIREEYQAERRKESTWSFLDNGERQEFAVTGYLGAVDASGRVDKKPIVVATYAVDDLNAHNDEFDSYYRLLEGIGAGRTYLATNFSAEDWEVSGQRNGRWTRLLTEGTIHLYAGALDRLTRIEDGGYWSLLARNLGITESELERHRRLARPSVSKDTLVARRSIAGRRYRRLIRRSLGVLKALRAARSAASEEERLRLLVEAVYRASFKRGDTFDPIILATLIEQSGVGDLIDRGEILVKGRITKAFEDENNLPERMDVVGRVGQEKDFEQIQYRFFPFNGIELYNMLNWARQTD